MSRLPTALPHTWTMRGYIYHPYLDVHIWRICDRATVCAARGCLVEGDVHSLSLSRVRDCFAIFMTKLQVKEKKNLKNEEFVCKNR